MCCKHPALTTVLLPVSSTNVSTLCDALIVQVQTQEHLLFHKHTFMYTTPQREPNWMYKLKFLCMCIFLSIEGKIATLQNRIRSLVNINNKNAKLQDLFSPGLHCHIYSPVHECSFIPVVSRQKTLQLHVLCGKRNKEQTHKWKDSATKPEH